MKDTEEKLSLNNKIEKAIRFNDFDKAINLCTKITHGHTAEILHEIDQELCKMDGNANNITLHHIIVEIRSKVLFPYIREAEQNKE